jgi:hypothetical protein
MAAAASASSSEPALTPFGKAALDVSRTDHQVFTAQQTIAAVTQLLELNPALGDLTSAELDRRDFEYHLHDFPSWMLITSATTTPAAST